MARTADPKTLGRIIDGLRSQRQVLADKLAAIDATFASLGITTEGGSGRSPGRPAGRGPGRPKGSKAGSGKRGRGRRRRGSFEKSGEQSVLDFVKSHGKPNAADVNAHWQGEGRGGKADNALSKMVKAGQLKRVEVKGERGSRYSAK